MRLLFKVESFEKSTNDLQGIYQGDDLEKEIRKMLTFDIWYYLDTISLGGIEILDYTISYSVYTGIQGDVRYSAVVSVKIQGD